MNITKRMEFSITGLSENQLKKIHTALGFMLDEACFTTPLEKSEYIQIRDNIETILNI